MAKYTADIEIAVRGAQQVDGLIKNLNRLNNSINVVNRNAKLLEGRGFNVASMENYSRAVFKAENAIRKAAQGTRQEEQAVKALVTAIDAENKARARRNFLIAQEVANRRQVIATGNAGFGLQGPQAGPVQAGRGPASPIRGTVNMPGSPAALAAAGTGVGARGMPSNISGAISSGLIGGGFPLLFGQGPAAAAGGALGGLAGGLVGGGFGFALSIVGTALGDAAEKSDTFNKQLASLNAQISTTGNAAKLTGADVDNLSKTLGIATDEAIKLLQSFAGFGDAKVTKALAFLYGDDAAILNGLAAAKDQAELAQVILGAYEKIGIERANQLINQLKIGDSAAVELAFQKALLEQKVKQTEEGLKQIKIQDYIIAGLATAGSFMGGGPGKLFDPAIFGKQRVEEFRKNNQPSQLFTNALKGLKQLRSAMQGVESLKPDKGAEKAARDAARLAEQRKKQLEDAARLAVSTDTQVKKAAALTKEEALQAEYDQKRMERMVKYETLYKQALSNAELEFLVTAQLNEVTADMLTYEKELLDIDLERSRLLNQTDPLANLQEEINLIDAKLRGKEEEYLRQQAINNLVDKGVTLDDAIAQVDTAAELNKRLQERNAILQTQTELFDSISSNVASAFSSAITTAIQGTEDLGAALNNIGTQLLGTIGNMLIMYGIAQALGALGGNDKVGIFTSLAKGFGFKGAADGGYWQGGFQAFADGGMVTRPTMGLVGEGGEAEYIIPASKMRGAMARYASGARGSAVIPSGGDTGGDMGGIAVGTGGAIDVRYTVERINSVDYVTADQFQRGMAQAASQGASQGEQRALKALQNNRSTRSRLGLR